MKGDTAQGGRLEGTKRTGQKEAMLGKPNRAGLEWELPRYPGKETAANLLQNSSALKVS